MNAPALDRRPGLGLLLTAIGLLLVALFVWLELQSRGFQPFRQYDLEYLYRLSRSEAGFYIRYLAVILPAGLFLSLGLAYLVGRRPFRGAMDRLDRLSEWQFRTLVVLVGAGLVLATALWVLRDQPITDDERVYQFQADLLAHGKLYERSHPMREFFDNVFIINNGKWTGKYPPGHPLALALGVAVGFPRLVPVLLAAINLLLFYQLARGYFPRRAARGAVLLLLASPFFLFTGATLLSHTTCLTALLLLAWGVRRSLETGGAGWAILAGLGAALAFLARPYTALLLGVPIGLAWAWALRERKQSWRPWLWAVGVASLGLLLLLGYNLALTGNPLHTGYGEIQGERGKVLGFGDVIPGQLSHTPLQGLLNVGSTVVRLNFWSWGWPFGWLFVVAALLWSRRRELQPVWWLLATTAVGSVFYFSLGISDVGPVKYYEILPALTLLSVAGFLAFDEKIGAQTRPGLGALAPAAMIVFCLLGWGLFTRLQIGELRRVTDRIAAPYRLVANLEQDRVLVFTGPLQQAPLDSWVLSTPTLLPEPDQRVVYARDLGNARDQALVDRMPDRVPYRLTLNDDRKYELTRLSGDPATRRVLDERILEARDRLQKKEFKEAIQILLEVIKIDPDYARAHLLLGWACEQGRLRQGADRAYRKAVELDPTNPDHYFFLGRFLGRQGRLSEALPLLEKAYQMNPGSRDIETALKQVRSGVAPP